MSNFKDKFHKLDFTISGDVGYIDNVILDQPRDRYTEWEISENLTMKRKTLTILEIIGPYLIQESTDDILSNQIKNSFKVNSRVEAQKILNQTNFVMRPSDDRIPKEKLELNSWGESANKNDLEIIIADLILLGLIEPGVKKRAVRDTGKYWKLSELGLELYKNRRKVIN